MAKGFKGSKAQSPMGMMGKLQKLQEQLAAAQAQLAEETVTGTAGGGAVKIVVTGDQRCQSVEIDPELFKDADVEMLQDLLQVAFNNALEASRALGDAAAWSLGKRPAILKPSAMLLPEPIENLIRAFSRLPGIGPKTASRLTFYLLSAPEEVGRNLAEALLALKTGTAKCQICFNTTAAGRTECEVCANPERDRSIICVVEEPLDVLALERTGGFRGCYHVLQGALSPIEGIGPEHLTIQQLLESCAGGGGSRR